MQQSCIVCVAQSASIGLDASQFIILVFHEELLAMAHDHHTPSGGHPAMDYKEHDDTFKGFIHFSEVAVVAILAIVAALAVGGVKHAWFAASMGTILALVTCGVFCTVCCHVTLLGTDHAYCRSG
jgi:uncharacterized membrane protein